MNYLLFICIVVTSVFGRPQFSRNQIEGVSFSDSVHSIQLDSIDAGVLFIPENSQQIGEPGEPAIPFREYRVAVSHSNVIPIVTYQVEKQKVLSSLEYRPIPERTMSGDGYKKNIQLYNDFRSGVKIEKSGRCRGQSIVSVKIPLAYYNNHTKSLSIYQKFSVSITIPHQARSGRVGFVDSFCRTINSKVYTAVKPTLLTKQPVALSDSITVIASLRIGDADLHTLDEDGVYGVSYKEIEEALISSAGGLVGISPDRLVLLTGRADTLNQQVPAEVLNPELYEIPMIVKDMSVSGGANQTFDIHDSLYFFGHGSALWKSIKNNFPEHASLPVKNYFSYSPYSFYHYYYLGYKKSGTGARLIEQVYTGSPQIASGTGLVYKRVEIDEELTDQYFGERGTGEEFDNKTGKEWFWKLTKKSKSSTHLHSELIVDHIREPVGYVEGTPAYVAVTFHPARSNRYAYLTSKRSTAERLQHTTFSFSLNDAPLELIDGDSALVSTSFMFQTSALASGHNKNIYSLIVDNTMNDSSVQRFDGYSLIYTTPNSYTDEGGYLFPEVSSGLQGISVGNTIQQTYAIKIDEFEAQSLFPIANGSFIDSVTGGSDPRYYLFNWGDVKKVEVIKEVVQSPYAPHALTNIPEAEYLIITPQAFASQAYALKQFRESGRAGYTVSTQIVIAEDIYRMYSSGRPSPVAIRDFIRFYYSQYGSSNGSFKNVLLFGDGHYDYRNLRETNRPNMIPPYEIESIGAEDFFTVLDSGELCPFGDYTRDIYVGRIPIETVQDASDYITKIREYEDVALRDDSQWRNRSLFVSDDFLQPGKTADRDNIQNHVNQSDALYKRVRELQPGMGTEHFFLHDYIRDVNNKKRLAAKNLTYALNSGQLFTSFFGHGGTVGWADEGLLRERELNKLHNGKKLTILCSFSCTVGRFEDGSDKVLGEKFVRQLGKGAIASIGALRESYSSVNDDFGLAIAEALFDTTQTITLGEALDIGKLSDDTLSWRRLNNTKYLLLGEPVLRLHKPNMTLSPTLMPDTVLGLDSITIAGAITGSQSGAGTLELSFFESDTSKLLKRVFNLNDSLDSTMYTVDDLNGRLLYRELIPYTGNTFSTTFLTPGSLTEGDTNAVIRAYFWENGTDKAGHFKQNGIVLGKRSSNADSLVDLSPPQIAVGNCIDGDYSEQYHGNTIQLAVGACLQFTVYDSLALDYSDTPGGGIYFTIDSIWNNARPQYLEQNSKKAVFRIEFSDALFEAGEYTLKVSATDLFNNTQERDIVITLNGALKQGLVDVYTIPNPLKTKATFYFKTMNDDYNWATVKIYNQRGKIVKVIPRAVSGRSTWNGRDEWGNYLANGLYYYKVIYHIPDLNELGKQSTYTKIQKLVISR